MLFLLLWNFVNKKKPILKKTSKTKKKKTEKTSDELDVSKTSNFCEETTRNWRKTNCLENKKEKKSFGLIFHWEKFNAKRATICENQCVNIEWKCARAASSNDIHRTHSKRTAVLDARTSFNWLIERIFNRLRKFLSISIDHVNASLLFGSSRIRSAWTIVWK